jgi:predicted dehydrogenase
MTVLVVGLGSIASKHIKALYKIDPQAKIIALRSSADASSIEGIENIYSWDAVSSAPDFVLISSPTRFHKEAIEHAAQIGCPLLIEKPVLGDTLGGEDLSQLLQQKNILTYTACNLRFHPCIVFLKKYLEKNGTRVNEVNSYCGSDLRQWRTGDYRQSYSARSEMGGGVHLDLIHEIDYCCWLFGLPDEVVSVKRKVSALQIDSYDFAAFHLNYPDFSANIVLNYYRPDVKRTVEILCEGQLICADLIKGNVLVNDMEVFSDPDFKMENTYVSQLEYFIDHIAIGKKMMNDFDEAFQILKLAVS